MSVRSLIWDQILVLLEANGLVEREPGDIVCVQFVSDERLRAVVVRLILGIQMDDKENELPQVVLFFDVVHETILGVFIDLKKEVSFLQ